MAYFLKWFLIGFLIVLTIGIIWACIFYTKQKPTPVMEKTEGINEELKEIDITDWKTYKNKKYGFEIKYPKDWTIPAKMKENENLIHWYPSVETPEKRFIFFRARKPTTLEEMQCVPCKLPSGERILGKMVINDLEFCKMEYKISGVQEIFYLLIKNGMGYDFGLAIYNKKSTDFLSEKEIEFELKILNQMLSTLRFIK